MFKEKNHVDYNSSHDKEDGLNEEKENLSVAQETLSPQERKGLEDLTLNFFTDYLNNNVKINDSFEAIVDFEDQINSFFESTDKDFDARKEYSNKLRAANKIVVTSLLDFCEQNHKHQNFQHFLKAIRNNFFSSSPGLSSNLSIEDKFSLTARATRAVETYGQIGGCMADDLVYSLSWEYGEEAFDKFLKSFKQSSYAEQFDELHLIKLIAANSAGTGSSYHGLDNIHKLLENMKESSDSALLRWAIDLTEARVSSEEENPTLGIVKFSENVGNLRLNESLSEKEQEDAANLEKLILPDVLVDPNNKIMRVASDTLAIVDHSNMPIKYGLFSEEEFEQKKKTENKMSIKDLTRIESILSQPGKINFENLINFLNNKILIPYYGDGNDGKQLAKAWSEINKNISLDDWSKFFKQQTQLEGLKNELQVSRVAIEEEMENNNFEASKRFLDTFKKEIDRGSFESLNNGFKMMIKDFTEAYDSGKIEFAYSTAVDFVAISRDSGDKASQDLALEFSKLKVLHTNNFDLGRQQVSDLYSKAEESNKELLESHYQAISSICAEPNNLLEGLAKKISELKTALGDEAVKVSFSPYNDLSKDEQIANFIPENNSDETILLLKHMHRPDMESYIKDNIGINLKEIPFRYQVYLLKFLSENNEAKIKEVADFINSAKSEDDRLSKIKSFLSLRVEEADIDRIILIDKEMKTDSGLVFDKVSQIVDLIDKKNEELQSMFFKENSEINFSALREKLLEKMHSIIVDFSNELADESNLNAPESILNKLENSKVETMFLVSVLESLKSSGHSLDLELIKNINLDIKDYSQEMSAADKKQIIDIATANWADFDNKEMAKTVLDGLKESLAVIKDQKAYILKYREDVIGFVRFEKTDHDNIYAGSFNVSKDLRGLSVGNNLMEKALISEGEKNVLEAAASIKISAGCSYVEKVGFIADGLIDSYHDTGEKMFAIKLDNKLNQGLKTKNLSEEEIKEKLISGTNLNKSLGGPVIVLRFDLALEMAEYEKALSTILPAAGDDLVKQEKGDYLLTRYFQDKTLPGDVRYLVFEKN